MKKRSLLLGAFAAIAAIGLIESTPPAKAATFDETISTALAVPGYIISLTGLTTDSSNVAQSLISGTVIGTGIYNVLNGGTLTLLPPNSENKATYSVSFAWDGVANTSAPYFTPSSDSSGILLLDTVGTNEYILNPYLGKNGIYYVSVETEGPGTESNPGNIVGVMTADISQTPLPGALSLFVGGIGVLGLLLGRGKKKSRPALG